MLKNGSILIDDTYNANPDSMRAAIDVLTALPGRRLFVMGDMGEVGADPLSLYPQTRVQDCRQHFLESVTDPTRLITRVTDSPNRIVGLAAAYQIE